MNDERLLKDYEYQRIVHRHYANENLPTDMNALVLHIDAQADEIRRLHALLRSEREDAAQHA